LGPLIGKYMKKPAKLTGRLKDDIPSFLSANGCLSTAEHSLRVGTEARRLALMFQADSDAAELAGWLHDISAVFPNNVRIAAAREWKIDILPEEESFPMIIHQKLSRYMAENIFKVSNVEVLSAVGCHTTLRAQSTLQDKVLFVADKIAWDRPGEPPYLSDLLHSLTISLDHAAFSYIDYLWQRKDTLKVIHPWLRDAYEELVGCV
jgi:predicted HD superfamily hydrolase involved in NAD metabolism